MRSTIETTFIAIAIIALVVGLVMLQAWFITWVVGWFGFELALWQGLILAVVFSSFGGARAAK